MRSVEPSAGTTGTKTLARPGLVGGCGRPQAIRVGHRPRLAAGWFILATWAGVPTASLGNDGAGSFFSPFVNAGLAIVVLSLYVACFVALSTILLRGRDVS